MEWVQARFGSSESITLAPTLVISVHQEIGTRGGPTPPWIGTVFGAVLVKKFDTREEAKAMVLRVAKKHLTAALALLETGG